MMIFYCPTKCRRGLSVFGKYIRYAAREDGSLEARIANNPDLAGRGQTFRMKRAD